jgi:hypothetical protein
MYVVAGLGLRTVPCTGTGLLSQHSLMRGRYAPAGHFPFRLEVRVGVYGCSQLLNGPDRRKTTQMGTQTKTE